MIDSPTLLDADLTFLAGGGEMGRLTREKDWSTTALGPAIYWPQSLRTSLSILLNSKFPMLLLWGPQLINFYNDAFRPSLGQEGKHPSLLGQPSIEGWSEIWDIVHPLFDQVMSGRGAVYNEDQLIPIYRNGRIEDVYWTFSYSPVNDESGKVAGVFVTCHESTKTVNALQSLKLNEEKLKIVMEASQLGTYELDLVTRGVVYSDRYLEILGYKNRIELTHPELTKHLHPDDLPAREKAFEDAYRTGHLYHVTRIIWHDGSIHWVEARGKIFYDDHHQPVKLIGTLRDVTDQRSFQQQLEKQVLERTHELEKINEDLKKINNELQNFAYVSSHDLQEPLRKIQLFASMVQEKEYDTLSPNAKRYFERMQEAAQRMQALIQDLLLYSRTNLQERKFEKLHLKHIVDKVVNDHAHQIEKLNGNVEVNEMCEAHVIPDQFDEMLCQLLSNAIKFAHPERSPLITINARIISGDGLYPEALSPHKHYCHLTITDNGIGFEPQYRERIFEVFQRLHDKTEYSGTGVGLAVVKKIVENHYGIIIASSNKDMGAQFDIYFPLLG